MNPSSDADAVLGGASAVGLDAFARVAVRLKVGLGSELTDLAVKDGNIVATRSQFAGKTFSDVVVAGDCKMFTVRSGAFGLVSPSLCLFLPDMGPSSSRCSACSPQIWDRIRVDV